VRRREFIITLIGGVVAAWPVPSWAQMPVRIRLIGVLWAGIIPGTPAAELAIAAFTEGLHELGWKEGENLKIEHRWVTSGAEQSKTLAKELVGLKPDALVVNSTPLLSVMASETRTIPIVFVRVADPVGQGLIASLARPGGNITGFTNFEFSMGGKWLQLLKDLSPSTERVAILFNPNTMPFALFVRSIEAAAPSFALQLQPSPFQNTDDVERIIEAFARERNSALVVLPDTSTIQHRQFIIRMVARNNLPTIYPYGLFAKDGGLISYGIDAISVYRDASVYVIAQQIRIGYQSKDGQAARPRNSPQVARARRRGDRMKRREFITAPRWRGGVAAHGARAAVRKAANDRLLGRCDRFSLEQLVGGVRAATSRAWLERRSHRPY
jgi:ABC-type uncharacterized transport system substrate-binding protein